MILGLDMLKELEEFVQNARHILNVTHENKMSYA